MNICHDISPAILVGDVSESLRALPAQSVRCVVTSPPYFGLRDYGHEGRSSTASSASFARCVG